MHVGLKLNRKIRLVIHSVGLSCLGASVSLQVLVFLSVIKAGYFRAVETNPTVLSVEIALTAFTVLYFIYIYQKIIRSSLK